MHQEMNSHLTQSAYSQDCPSILHQIDPELWELEQSEIKRQSESIELVASENYAHPAVLKALSSVLQNKYSEGQIGKRYYGGCNNVDAVESLCIRRALDLFKLDESEWHVIVQPLSGSSANFAVYTGLAGPNCKIMGLTLSEGGHLSHGHKANATSKFFQSQQYKLDPKSCLIDYEGLEDQAKEFKPDIIIAGISAYSRELDYAKFREICDKTNSYLVSDMAHISGLVAGKVLRNNPFDFSDVVVTTTHKSLRGPRAAMIFVRKNSDPEKNIAQRIQSAHFPGLTGGPHNNKILALATALKLANSQEFQDYAKMMIANARAIGETFKKYGFPILTGGTDVHMVLVNVNSWSPSKKLLGSHIQSLSNLCGVSLNMNAVPGDASPFRPSGLRLGSPQITTRGVKPEGAVQIAEILIQIINLGEKIVQECESEKVSPKEFDAKCALHKSEISSISEHVKNFIKDYPIWT